MSKTNFFKGRVSQTDQRSSLLFLGVGLIIIAISVWNWHYDIKPRLINEAQSSTRILAASHARAVESLFENVSNRDDISKIYNALNEMLLINDPSTAENLYLGLALEVDYDVIQVEFNSLNFSLGKVDCSDCIATENPIFNRRTGELVAVIKIFANPIFYQRMVGDIVNDLTFTLLGIIAVLIIGWLTSMRLMRRLRERELSLVHEIAERKSAEDRLHQIAAYDQLTNLPNRYLLQADFARKIEESGRNGKLLAVLFFDLDYFKKINDVHGHETGDALLAQVSERMSSVTRNYDLLARFGGDEFVMIMSNLDERSDVIPVVEKIISGFRVEFDLPAATVRITTSVGVSIFPEDGRTSSELLKNADVAMYRAKAEGRNCYQFFNVEMNLELHYAQWVETSLRKALTENRLQLHFQPQVNLETDEVESCEALIRWPQGDGEHVDPADFIKIAERTGLINDISLWVLNEACRTLREWRELGYNLIRVDINLSSKDFADKGVLFKFLQTLRKNNLQPNQIGIEISENILQDSSNHVTKALSVLHNAGVHIAIDDFGTGYSSLNYLKQLPLSGIKIDQAFVHDAPSNKEDLIIMQAITLVGHGFGLSIVAEGVESEWHHSLCREVGVNAIQGNYVSAPLPAQTFASKYLKKP